MMGSDEKKEVYELLRQLDDIETYGANSQKEDELLSQLNAKVANHCEFEEEQNILKRLTKSQLNKLLHKLELSDGVGTFRGFASCLGQDPEHSEITKALREFIRAACYIKNPLPKEKLEIVADYISDNAKLSRLFQNLMLLLNNAELQKQRGMIEALKSTKRGNSAAGDIRRTSEGKNTQKGGRKNILNIIPA
ncbi:MAG: hypothetical protein ABIH99_03475 [Candidatus Micrarchaeota archaeon]